MDCRGRDGGFTLLEIIVAFIIAAIGLAALVQGASGGLGGAQAAAHYQEAVSRAQSRLALLAGGRLQAGEQRGDDGGGFSWRVFVQPGASTAAPKAPPRGGGAANPTSQSGAAVASSQTGAAVASSQTGAAVASSQTGAVTTSAQAEQLVLYAVSVTIGWTLDGGDRQVTLYSQRLGLTAPDGP